MSNNLVPYIFESTTVRTLLIDDEPWFVAADVCAVLELWNVSHAVGRLDDDEKGVTTNDTLGGAQEMLIINEPGLYSLIMTSRKPQAKMFKRWVVHEVLPAIRKTGHYGISPEQLKLPTTVPEALVWVRDLIDANLTLSSEVTALTTPAQGYLKLIGAINLLSMEETVKTLNLKRSELSPKCGLKPDNKPLGRQDLFNILRNHGLFTGRLAGQRLIDTGYCVVKTRELDNQNHAFSYTLFTLKGIDWLRTWLTS